MEVILQLNCKLGILDEMVDMFSYKVLYKMYGTNMELFPQADPKVRVYKTTEFGILKLGV